MNKRKFDGILVVEGKTDREFLSSFLEGEIITTNGSEVPRETIEYLKTSSRSKPIIVLTDPDFPGLRIRKLIESEIPGAIHAHMDRSKCIGRHKLGVAESSQEAVLEALDKMLPAPGGKSFTDVCYSDLLALGLAGSPSSKDKRIKIMDKMGLGYGNAKTMLSRLAHNRIMLDKLKEAADEL